VRRLLDYCKLSFEPQCLRFYENRRVGANHQLRTGSATHLYRRNWNSGAISSLGLEPLKIRAAGFGRRLPAFPIIPKLKKSGGFSGPPQFIRHQIFYTSIRTSPAHGHTGYRPNVSYVPTQVLSLHEELGAFRVAARWG